MSLVRRAVAEAVGTGLLVTSVVGSGIAATRLSPGQPGLQLLENSLATGAALVALVVALQPVSAAFNPVVTVVERLLGALTTRVAAVLVGAQVAGGALGSVVANLMFDLPPALSTQVRTGPGLWLGEVVATLGLVLVVLGSVRSGRGRHTGFVVAAWITGAYWFTSSTSFANPAVTLARTLTDSFTGISPGSAPGFVLAQVVGGGLGLVLVRLLYPDPAALAVRVTTDRGAP